MTGFFDDILLDCEGEEDRWQKKIRKRVLLMMLSRFMAAQDVLDSQSSVSLDMLCSILGLDLTQHNKLLAVNPEQTESSR